MTTSLVSWGRGDHGQLGQGGSLTEPYMTLPTQVEHLPWIGEKTEDGSEVSVQQVAVGHDHSVVLTTSGKIYVCGSNDFSQLGHDKSQSRFEVINSLSPYNIQQIACGGKHTLAIDEWGKVFSWGHDDKGQLGQNSGKESWPTPKMIRGLGTVGIVQVACGFQHSLVLTDSGRLFSFGDNTYGQLGLGPSAGERVLTPQPMECMSGLPIKSIACGGYHSVVITGSGAIYSWGRNNMGQLGLGDLEDRVFPAQIKNLKNHNIVRMKCGREHTICLTKDGGVWSFGASDYGQLGQGKKEKEMSPRQIVELMGTEVSQIECGNRHTLAFVPSRKRLYAFGLGGSGQLGRNNTQNANTPQTVVGPWVQEIEKDKEVYLVGAGGDQNFACVCPTVKLDNFIQDQRILPAFCQMKILTPALVDKIAEVKEDAMLDQDFMEHVETIFQSKASLNGSFLTPAHQPCNSRNSGIDMPSWQNFYKVIENCHHDSLREAIHSSITQFVIPNLRMTPPDVETLRIFLTLPLYHRFQDPELFEDLHTPFAKCLISLDKNPWSVVEKWLCQQDANYFKLIVQNIKKVVILILKKKTRSSVTSYNRQLELNLVLLRILNRINVEQNLIIDYEDFYIPEVSEYLPLPEQYGRWLLAKKNGGSSGDFYICNYPFVFDAQAKSTLLQVDQAFQMQQAVQEAHHKAAFFHQMIFNPAITPEMMSFLHLNVDRENLLQDTLAQIQLLTPDDLKKPMRVQFNGEDGEDAGGVKKEFFLLLLKDLLNPKYGMFKEYDESRTIWFHPNSFEDNVMFFLIGVICGLAIYNFTIISLPYPLALYKKLLSEKVNRIEDFQELSPTEARGLKDLLEYEGDDIEDVFCLDFAISETCFDVTKSVPLKEGGEQIPVTKANREEYVSLYCDYILNKSCKKQYEAFHQGFHKVCGGRVLDLFHARELMTLVVGKEVFDWEELEKTAEYKNGYDKDHPTIVNFWEVFHSLSTDEKRKFLLFLTGSDRMPILGIASLKVIIQKTGDESYLPVAHTCFNVLDLPAYATKERLKYKLLKAIQHTQGFGLA